MRISDKGINLIKSYEGLRLLAYKPVPTETYFTIGYEHYGKDVSENMVITEETAIELLEKDLVKYEKYVDKYNSIYHFNQNQFDALVSFTYNCGNANLKKLLEDGARPLPVVATKMLEYNKAGGKVLKGLARRRAEEQELFNTPVCDNGYYKKYTGCSVKLDTIFEAIGVEPTYIGNADKRKAVAEANGIENYKGTYGQNISLIKLAKLGSLRRVKEV